MKKIFKKIIEDIQRAQENHEEYQRLQHFYKGKYAEPMALIEFMHLDYLPKRLVKFIHWKVDMTHKFFNWAWDFRRLSLITLAMICAIIYIVFN